MWSDIRVAIVLSAALFLGGAQDAAVASGGAVETVDFERRDLAGDILRLSDFHGQWVVVNFWATWCGPCIREIPLLNSFHRTRDDATVIGVNFEEIRDAQLERFVDEMQISYPVVRAGSEPLLPFEPLKGLPSTFVVSPRGDLVALKVGEVDRSWLYAATPLSGGGAR